MLANPGSSVYVNGRYLFLNNSNPNVTADVRWSFKGINYIPIPSDKKAFEDMYTLNNVENFETNHLPLLLELGVNAIRVKHLTSTNDHREFMRICRDNEIFVLVDIEPDFGPIEALKYDETTWQAVMAYVNEFMMYSNTLAFVLGENLLANQNSLTRARYVKSLVRDVKYYLLQNKRRLGRLIPVTYGQLDSGTPDFRRNVLNYLTCGAPDTQVDITSLNVQRWDPDRDEEGNGYSILYADLANWDRPVMFSQFGALVGETYPAKCPCKARTFGEVYSAYTNGSKILSGGFQNEFTDEHVFDPGHPGNVPVNMGLCTMTGNVVAKKQPAFDNLKYAYSHTPWPTDSIITRNVYGKLKPLKAVAHPCPTGDGWAGTQNLLPYMPPGSRPTPAPTPPTVPGQVPTPAGESVGGGLGTPVLIGIIAGGVVLLGGGVYFFALKKRGGKKDRLLNGEYEDTSSDEDD